MLFPKLIQEIEALDFTIPGSFHVSSAQLEAMSPEDVRKMSRIIYYKAGRVMNAVLSKTADEDGVTISWSQS